MSTGVTGPNPDALLRPSASKVHHFSFQSTELGVVRHKESLLAEEHQTILLKKPKEEVAGGGLPPAFPPGGLSEARRQYLQKEVRPYVPVEYHEAFCALKLSI